MISTKEPETQMTISISLLAIISISVLFVVKLLAIELLLSDDVNLSAMIGGINLHMSQLVSDFDYLFWQYYRSGLKYVWPLSFWFGNNIYVVKVTNQLPAEEWVINVQNVNKFSENDKLNFCPIIL